MEQQQMEQLMEQQMVLHIAMEPSTQMVTADTMIVHFQMIQSTGTNLFFSKFLN